ncbi:RICIN domain-containing protein [Streptomyces sp. NPDC058953]|uniref:RICIN domain-containing protein n=1 Tax=unclassified Streptomyces TaxID=2593676 RepID=UPI0036BB8808
MRSGLRARVVTVASAVALTLGMSGTATAGAPAPPPRAEGAAAAEVTVQQVTLRLSSDPGQVANVKGASTANGAEVIQWPWSGAANERWEPEPADFGYFRFKSVNSGLCLNIEGASNDNGARAIQWTCGTDHNEQWQLVPKGRGYQIVARHSGKCLNVAGGVGQGNGLIQWPCAADGADNDVWLPVWEQV